KSDGKGRYMRAVRQLKGRAAADILAEAMPGILRRLPCPKQMKWQDGAAREDAFIRPIRWIVARLGEVVIPFAFAGIEAGCVSRGHRVHGGPPAEMDARDPFGWLRDRKVLADREARRREIARKLADAARERGVQLVEDDALLEEVTDLVEWPCVVTAEYDPAFLRLPEEVARIELKHHQRCFAARTAEGGMSHVFFAVANIESTRPELVAAGNARVVNARLADAAFYFDRDPKVSLEARVEKLNGVVFQEGLGMVGDQVRRLRGFVLDNAAALGVDANDAQRAALLCKSDLTTGLVYEFPELQGYMGGIYARMDGESEAVARGIAEHYLPEAADDPLPESRIARAIGIAERADKLLGYFHIGRMPSASADPFGLRRAAIGLVRLLADASQPVEMPLEAVLAEAAKQWNQQRVTIAISEGTRAQVRDFILERLLGMAESLGVPRVALDAALHAAESRPLYQTLRIARLLAGFADSETGQAVAAANKRIANILNKAGTLPEGFDAELLTEPAERALLTALAAAERDFPEDPAARLEVLAGLREPVDRFFDEVMVMVDDAALRAARLGLLARLRRLFLRLADVSRLSA
ncbi:MAG: glycine--tRNA ligase subunit beta, partial [Mariprofundaceae bacterium]